MTRRAKSKPIPSPGVWALLEHTSPGYPPRVEPIGVWRPYYLSPGYAVVGLYASEAAARTALEGSHEQIDELAECFR